MKKISKRKTALFLAFFLFFFMSFRTINLILPVVATYYFFMLAAIILIYLYQCKKNSFKLNIKILCVWGGLFIPAFFNNKDIQNAFFLQAVVFASIFVMLPLLVDSIDWVEYPWKAVRVYCTFHFLAGLFFIVDQGALKTFVIPHLTFPDGGTKDLLLEAVDAGYMTGLCNHYSTMGMIMSICVISFSDCLFYKNKDYRKIAWFLITLVGLAMTGKRGPLLFTLIAVVLTVFIFSDMKLSFRSILTGIGSIIMLAVVAIVAYLKVPQVKTVIERFTEANTGDVNGMTTGRVEYFWIPALKMFRSSPFIGHGWRSFSYGLTEGAGNLHGNDAHNIYIQLLAETGIVGTLMVFMFMAYTWFLTFRQIKRFDRIEMEKESIFLKLSLTYQSYFLLYGLTGNPLYDIRCYPLYLICALMAWAYAYIPQNALVIRSVLNRISGVS